MSDYDRLRNVIVQKLKRRTDEQVDNAERDSDIEPPHFIRASAVTLYMALQQAAAQLHCDVSEVVYKILDEFADERSGDKRITIRAHKRKKSADRTGAIGEIIDAVGGGDTIGDSDAIEDNEAVEGSGAVGDSDAAPNGGAVRRQADSAARSHPPYSIKKQSGQIMVRIDPSHVEFKQLTADGLQTAIRNRNKHSVDIEALAQCIATADNAYHVVGTFMHDLRQDATHSIAYTNNNLAARLTLSPPKTHGNEFSVRRLLDVLNEERIVHGVDRALLGEIEEYPQYNHRYTIATGTPPIHGKNAHTMLSAELKSAPPEVDSDERVNYKEHSDIVNVIKGTPIAYLTPALKGRDGKNVFGDVVRSQDGKQKQLLVGRNVVLEDNDRKAVAACDGKLKVIDGLLIVDPIHTVEGDVGTKSGNILFLGDVLVKGNVNDNFSVRASGTIEIIGFVGAAELDSESGIKIYKGIAGKGRAFINSGGDCISQYVEHATVHAARSVIVSESIIQSHIVAGERVRCAGKRANIVGGTVTAGVQVAAKTIGSDAGTQTKISVGLDPFRVMRLESLRQRHNALSEQLRHLTLMQRKSDTHSRHSEVEYKMSKAEHVQRELSITKHELVILEEDMAILNEEIAATQRKGEICAFQTLYQNAAISINNVTKSLRQTYTNICLVVVGGKIVSHKGNARQEA